MTNEDDSRARELRAAALLAHLGAPAAGKPWRDARGRFKRSPFGISPEVHANLMRLMRTYHAHREAPDG